MSGPGEGQGLRSWSEKWAELTGKWAGAEGGQGLGQWGLASGRCLWWMTGEWGGLVNGQGLGCRGRESGRGLGEREVERAYEI